MIRVSLPSVACVLLPLSLAASACRRRAPEPAPPADVSFRGAASVGEWTLVRLFGAPAPLGASGRAATIVFDADSARAGGFSGCNRMALSYTLGADSLAFGPVITTKMACDQGMELERRLVEALERTTRYELRADTLVLVGAAAPVARFERRR